jgi:hypothetical protein
LPPRFIDENPKSIENLRINKNRLTTPYDLHITLRDILRASVKKKGLLKAVGCRHCRSLFKDIPINRRCQDAAIPVGSCPCSYQKMTKVKKVIKLAANFAVDALNKKREGMKDEDGKTCTKFKLKRITDAQEQVISQLDIVYIVRFTVSPSKAHFEANVKRKFSTLFSTTPKFELLHEVVQMNENTEPNICVSESESSEEKKLTRRFEEEYEEEDFDAQKSFPFY